MRINSQIFNKQNNIQHKQQNFEAGMTAKILNQIETADTYKISNNLAKKGIDSDFKENKTLAWCCATAVALIEKINEKFGEKMELPEAIYVDDFTKMNISSSENTSGFCNFFPTPFLYKPEEFQFSKGNAVFFNSHETDIKKAPDGIKWFYDWKNISAISDIDFATGMSTTPHFLNVILHEFAHAIHENNILKNIDVEKMQKKFVNAISKINLYNFNIKNGEILEKDVCKYAATSPFEAIACDMPKKIIKSLDDELELTSNPFAKTIYSSNASEKIPEDSKTEADKLLSKIWDGEF
ncbi:MAG: hypothetical protein MJ229_00475 [bacterium]|nr:hypothetical protein [bacterium]